jgi:hypothetical protein
MYMNFLSAFCMIVYFGILVTSPKPYLKERALKVNAIHRSK